MVTRKSVLALSATEKANYVNGVKKLKDQGRYDWYVQIHQDAMPFAHRGPAFLPWHRQFLRLYERDLQQALGDDSFALPYWDWAHDAALPDPTKGVVWGNDFMGGQGTPVSSGPFAAGQWTIWPSGSLVRNFAQLTPTLPTQTDVNNALAVAPYDSASWNAGSNPSFRNQLEGWINGPQLHNRVHVWVGGSMLPMTSPNDPVFFLHHCNVDRIWAQWQAKYPSSYLPISGAQPGHNLNDSMWPWDGTAGNPTVIPADMLDYLALGYQYDPAIFSAQVTGTFQKSSAVAHDGNFSYQMDTNYHPMIISGSMPAAGSISFYAQVPRWNPAAKCGDTQDKNVVIWITLNGQELVPLRVSNWQVPTTHWQSVGPIPLNQGNFVLQLSSGEGDGCGWPENTDPFYVSGITIT